MRLSDGRVLISGGYVASDQANVGTAELYDPKTGTFSATGSMMEDRADHSETLSWLSSAGIYDPKTGAFGPTGSMTTS